jgi:hypothetical protein
MKHYLTSLFLLATLFTYSQTNFQKGYFIKANNEKIECLIKNEDWSNNPTQFNYKLSETSEVQTADIDQIIAFEIENESKYIKQKVDIDMSSNNLKNLSYLKEPDWKTQTVFLKVLLEGDASLYFYAAPGLNRYFYNIKNGDIIQLIYKRYYIGHQKVKSNNDFRQQLLNSFSSCKTLEMQDYKNVNYNAPSLSKLVTAYNNCLNSQTVSYSSTETNLEFNLKIKGGLNITSVNNVKNGLSASRNASFGNMLGYRFALESEIILPFNNNKWGLFFEFAKNQKISKETEAGGTGNVTISYDYLEGTLGMRHYLFLNQDSKASIHLGYTWDLFPEIEMDYETYNGFNGDSVSGSFLIGVGYHYKKVSIEGRMNINKPVFENNTTFYSSDFYTFNVTLGYTIL